MKTRDAEALAYVLESGLWKIDYETGDILTRRDRRGRDTDPPIWRSATFLNPSKKSSTRKRIWVKGRRVYANRVAWVLHNQKPIPEGFQIDHDDDDSLNDRPSNLVLMDAEGNRVKELANGKVKRFQPGEMVPCSYPFQYPFSGPEDYIGPAETTAILRGEGPSGVIILPGRPQTSQEGKPAAPYAGSEAPASTSLAPSPDWRINLLKEAKQACIAFLARLRGVLRG